MKGKITKRAIDALKPGATDVWLWDTELRGFGYRLTPAGKGIFLVKYDVPGLHRVTRRFSFGVFSTMTPDQARNEAKAIQVGLRNGIDPLVVKRANRRSTRDETVKVLFEAYLAEKQSIFTARTSGYYRSLSRRYILPAFGKRPVESLSKEDLRALWRTLETTPVTANRVVRLIGMFYHWLADDRGMDVTNPAHRFKGYPERARQTFLSVEEMGQLGEALRIAETVGLPPAPERAVEPKHKRARNAGMFKSELQPANPVAVSALRFLALTGWRKQEALTLRWSDVDLTTGAVTLPNTKTGESHRTIGGAALEILATQPRVHGSAYVFPGRAPGKPFQEIQRLWYAVRHAANLSHVRLHDLRHSAASVAGSHGYSLLLIGKLLGHKTARSTERYAHQHRDASRAVADSVSGAIDAALNGSKTPVTPMRLPQVASVTMDNTEPRSETTNDNDNDMHAVA